MKKHIVPFCIFICAALAIALPVLFSDGQIFLLDMVMPPQMSWENVISHGSGAPPLPSIMLFAVSAIFSVGVAQKILMMIVLLLPMVAMYFFLFAETKRTYAVLGGILLLFNPFMYERFATGHWFVMLGVAYLPLVFYFLRRLLFRHSYKHTLLFALIFALYPLISLHVAYIGALLVLLYLLVYFVLQRGRHTLWRDALLHCAIVVAVFLAINSFWIVPSLQPTSTFQSIDQRDFATFVTSGDPTVGVYGNVLALYGFWREGAVLPKDLLSFWFLPSLIIFLLALVGILSRVRRRDPLALTLLLVSPFALILAVGYATLWTEGITRSVSHMLPGFTGLRETAKLVGIFVFLYAFAAPLGLEVIIMYLFGEKQRARFFGAIFLLSCVFATSYTFLWGAVGHVAVAEYPHSWRKADQLLMNDPSRTRVLVFPWRGYLEAEWAHRTFIANPAHLFFSFPVHTSPSINNVLYDTKYTTEFDEYIPIDEPEDAVRADIAALRSLGVSHVVLLRTSDWKRYAPVLSDTQYFETLFDEQEIAVFRLK